MMRTTLTLDDDVAAKLDAESRKSGRSFKETVNHYLRLGLNAKKKAADRKPFKVRAQSLGTTPGVNHDSIARLIEQIEGPIHR
jgi:hypothetical protein